MITLLPVGGTPLILPPTFHWSDEGRYRKVAQTHKYLLPDATTGEASLLIQSTILAAGRPVTLVGACTLNVLMALQAMEVLDVDIALSMTGRPARTVRFASASGPAIDMEPIVDYADPDGTDWFRGEIKLIEV